ncbi:6-phosphogluconolactonase [Cellulomonas marina]|uniref:6-phosphogluconolactonase n=1 Tax=Cellulomonas marina TaxID=988821 RepID=A0A1I0ZWU1_9CELL|nr:6-phosphogluconolactonase [Cellulomonas marina]GIG29429.1 6-phosphogluconolactonase [Cellulomonas marina]SFB30215.1 6-phosphogluconolactonase [Cellulomonas marina]
MTTPHPLRDVVVHPDAATLAEATAARLLTAVLDAQSHHRPVHLVLTGGTVGIRTLAAVAANPVRDAVDWTGVHLWWGDERFVPAGDPDRNETQAREALLDTLGDALPAANVHAVPAADVVGDPEAAAAAYAEELAAHAPEGAALPELDVLLLGMGPDGHVASLFPDHPGLDVVGRTTTGVHDSPKPPPLRVSLTFEAIRSAREVWVVAAGEEKADAVAAALGDGPVAQVPAAGAVGRERTRWLLDVAAASRSASDAGTPAAG